MAPNQMAKEPNGRALNYVIKQCGRYQLTVVDEAGNMDRVDFEVINR